MIDVRSDTVTMPTKLMKKAMFDAELGDDVFKDDPTVNRLEELAAEMTGKEAALFFPTGTQSNLCALLSHCQRGEEYICGQGFHCYKFEAGGAAVLGGIQPQPLNLEEDGSLNLESVKAAIKQDDFHFAKTKLLCLENTIGGKALSLAYMKRAVQLAEENKLSTHLDGARVFNAATELKTDVKEITSMFDSVSVCLSKGLCAPAGSVLCGKKEIVESALRWRKMTGGGMRQSGVLAAAGIISLTHMTGRLSEDHEKAELFVKLLREKTSLKPRNHTNMVMVELDENSVSKILEAFGKNKIKALIGLQTRFVFHHDIQFEDVETLVDVISSALHSKAHS